MVFITGPIIAGVMKLRGIADGRTQNTTL